MLKKIQSAITFFIVLAFVFSCQSKDDNTAETTSDLRLITHNVWYGFTKVPERKKTWLEWMKARRPDVVSLQELNEYTPEMLASDALYWGHPHSVLLKQDGFPTGVTSKYPINDIRRFREGFHHGLIRVKIMDIYFYIIHLHPSNWETRNREIDLILSDIKNLPLNSEIVLAGDFNTFSPFDSVYYAHGRLEPFFNERDKAYQEVNLRDGRLDYTVLDKLYQNGFYDLEAMKRSPDYQFTGSFPTRIEKEGEHGDQRRLDYVFVSEGLSEKVVRAEIIADDTTWILSDHLPVIIDFEL